jgi:hypothetical protein
MNFWLLVRVIKTVSDLLDKKAIAEGLLGKLQLKIANICSILR